MIALTSTQQKIVEGQVSTGQYGSAEEVIDLALELLQFLDSESLAWLKQTQKKIQVGIDELERGEGVNGTIVMDRLLKRFQDAQAG